jgi:putative Mg2+ transporter-C (MgtC) family protein
MIGQKKPTSGPASDVSMETLSAYWSVQELHTNGIILLHLLGALAVGVLIGYERSYHGRAAGIRTYALVCVASCVLTVITAYPAMWFGGTVITPVAADPTRVIQGIITGIGFLGAGVIMKEGFSIRGLSTAASIWMTASIGIVIGMGFYGAAIMAAAITVVLMSGVRSIEGNLPHQTLMHLSATFAHDRVPDLAVLKAVIGEFGYGADHWSFELAADGRRFNFQLMLNSKHPGQPDALANRLAGLEGIVDFRLSPERN